MYPKEGVVKYRLGIGVRGSKARKSEIISLYGAWKFNRKFGLNFEMEYAQRKIDSLAFGAQVNFNKNNQIVVALRNEFGTDLGMSVIFTHKFLKQLDAQFYLRLKQYKEESGIDASIRIPF